MFEFSCKIRSDNIRHTFLHGNMMLKLAALFRLDGKKGLSEEMTLSKDVQVEKDL